MAKIHRFAIIAQRSIANIVNIPGRVGHSMDDECLGITIIRRGKYASLSNLDRLALSDELSSRENSKSLTTLVTEDTISDANDYNSDINDLSVAEKSMRMLKITAEDVMDARARIQERSYWNERDAKVPEVIKEVVAQSSSEKNEEVTGAPGNKQKDDLEKVGNRALRKEDAVGHSSAKKEEEKDKNEIIAGKEEILAGNRENISLATSNNVTSDEVNNHVKSTETRDTWVRKKRERKKGVAKVLQCPSFQNPGNAKVKLCASFVRNLEVELGPVPVNQREEWLDRADRGGHSPVNAQLTPTGSGASKKEHWKNSQIPCACRHALRNGTKKNGRQARSVDIDGQNVKCNINGKEFRLSIPIVSTQRGGLDRPAYKYSEAYRLKKQIQRWEESCGRQTSWGNKSLAQTARPSGYAKEVADESDKSFILKCRRGIQTETLDESTMMSDSLSERYRLERKMRSKRLFDLRSVYNVAQNREKNYAKAHEAKMRVLETCNNFTLKSKEETRAKKRHDLLPADRKLSIEEREAMETRASRIHNELTSSEDKRESEVRKGRDSSLNHGRLTQESEVMKVLKIYNDPILPEDKGETEGPREHNLSPSSQRSVDELARLGSGRELHTERKRDLSRHETPSSCVEGFEASVSNHLSIGGYYESILMHRNASRDSDLNDGYARQAHVSPDLREITRNIECIVHPRGVILTNKNLHSRFLENERHRESQQRDIVDDNTASALHSAFFSKPEIITRIFRRAQARIDESFPSFPMFRREDLDTEFVCRMNNEMVVCNRNSLLDLERIMGNERNTLGDSVLSHANDNRGTGGERGHDLCIIFIGRERIPSESETVIMGDSTTGSQENARSSVESTRTTNILIFDEDCDHADSTIDDNLPIRLITGVLRNFDIEMSEGGVRDVASPNEEYVNNVNVYNNLQSRESNVNSINLDEENNERDRISLHGNVDDTIHKIERTLNSSNNPDNVNVTSYVSSSEKLNESKDEKYLNTIDTHSETEIRENNLENIESTDNSTMLQVSDNNNDSNQFDTLDNKNEKSMFNRVFKNSSKLSFPGPSSFMKSENCHALRSRDEELKKLTQLSNSTATLNDQRTESISNLKITNCDTVPQGRHVESLKLETTIQDSARRRNESRSEFLAEKLFKMHSDDKLQQDDSFYFTYERNDDPGTPVSLENGSMMEEFLNDPISPFNSSYS